MKKLHLLLLSFLAITLFGCDEKMTFEQISMDYVNPEIGVIGADGGEITLSVASTHSFRLTTNCPSDVFFFRDGVVDYDKNGVALVTTNHAVSVGKNTGNTPREIHIYAKQQHNAEMSAVLIYLQSPKEKE